MSKANIIPKIDTFTAASFKAVREGKASEQQQQEFFRFVCVELGMIQSDAYADSERDTAFMLGRQWVARQVVSICDVDMIELAKKEKGARKVSR